MERIRAFARKYEMFRPGDRVLLGFSGGADSVFLLLALLEFPEFSERPERIRAVHVHHGLRGEEADRDAAFSETFCRERGIACRVIRIDAKAEARAAGISVEEAGREARYRLLKEEADAWASESAGAPFRVRIATAHHAGDSAETFLENLFRGTGLPGLSGIPPVRGNILRPLLCVSGGEIREYLKGEGISWVEDSTNGEPDYTRNRIRNLLLPEIEKEINPRAAEHIAAAAGRLVAADEYIRGEAERWLSLREEKESGGGMPGSSGVSLPARELLAAPEALRAYILKAAMKDAGIALRDVGAVHIEAALDIAAGQTGRRCPLPGGASAIKGYGRLLLCPGTDPREDFHPGSIVREILEMAPEEVPPNFPDDPYTKWMDYDKIKGVLCVRTRREGDYFFLESGGRKTLKAYFIDEKIPAGERDRVPLIADGSHILWIVGGRISAGVRITPGTRRILKVTYKKGAEDGRESSGR